MFNKIFEGLSAKGAKPDQLKIDAKASRGAPGGGQSLRRGLFPKVSVAPKGGPNSKLHAGCDGHGRPLMLLSEAQMSDYKGEALVVYALPKPTAWLDDLGYDAAGAAPRRARPLASPQRATGKR